MRSLSSIVGFVRSEGIGSALRRALWVVAALFHKDQTAVFLVCPLTADSDAGGASDAVRDIDEPEAHVLRRFLFIDPPTIQARFGRGDRLLGVFDGDDVMAYAWFSESGEWLTTIEREFEVGEGEVYVYNVRTLPAYRGRGLFPAIVHGAVPSHRAAGVARYVTVVEEKNVPSLRAFAKAGFHPLRSVRMVKRFGRRLYTEKEIGH